MTNNDNKLKSSLEDKIWGNLVHQGHSIRQFFPTTRLNELLERCEVEATLRLLRLTPEPKLVDFIMRRAQTTFAILITIEKPEMIQIFYDNDIGQEELPVEIGSAPGKRLCFAYNWKTAYTRAFFCQPNQWWFTTPKFVTERFRYKFEESCRLPFTKYDEGNKGDGVSHYSWVEERSIHVDHLELRLDENAAMDESGNPRVALKTLKFHDKDLIEREARVLEMIREFKSDHLIKAIAYYQHGKQHCFMFPWAEHGNLWEFWMAKGNRARLSTPYLIWAFVQLNGLADAIEQLHGKSHSGDRNCRHGDLKPENILCFRAHDTKVDDSAPRVRMVITDVGIARNHQAATQFREATRTTVSTKRYAAPEMEVNPNGSRSRRFDIWGIGCIFLEFAIWLLYGPEELAECTKALDPTFYRIINDKTGPATAEVHPTVQKWMSYMKKDWRCSKGTALRRLVDLIENKLLIVDVPNVHNSIEESMQIMQINESLKYRTYAEGMREDLNDILKRLRDDSIDSIGTWKGLEKDRSDPKGPSHSTSSTEGGMLAPGSPLTRKNLTDNWIYTSDNTFPFSVFSAVDLAAVVPQVFEPKLCIRCRHLNIWSIKCEFLDSRISLEDKAREYGCELCHLLSHCIRDRSYSPHDFIRFARVESCLALGDGKDQPVVNLCTIPGPLIKPLENVQVGFSKLPEAGSEAHFKILREWLRSCDCTHDCMHKECHFVPTRLLDISDSSPDVVRLLETSTTLNDPQKYLALSHRWGLPQHHAQFCLRKSNFDELKRGFMTWHLPKTFRDAISVARGLQVNYLWIDSVCIIQDDSNDWDNESKLMEQVFSSAYCTIAASCASGTSDGFLKQRPERRCISMKAGDAIYYMCEAIDDFRGHVDQSELNQRGWVMQERALSRRTIYFAENQSYWECGAGVRCETMNKMKNRKASFLGDANFPQSAEQYVKGLKIEFFQDIYERFSKLALSHVSDRPVAIKGLETRLLNTFGTTGGYGLFNLYLHRSLLWRRGCESLYRIETRGEPVPSWSWMAYDGAIRYLSVPGGNVSWRKDIKSPFPNNKQRAGHGQVPELEAPVWDVVDEPATGSIFLDEPFRIVAEPMQCVVVGTSEAEPSNQFQTHWVILVRGILKNDNDSGRHVYERLGVAILERRHIDFQSRARDGSIR